MLERIIRVRQDLGSLRRLVASVDDVTRRLVLEQETTLAEGFLARAVEASHRFVFDEAVAELTEARRRLDGLERRLVNPD